MWKDLTRLGDKSIIHTSKQTKQRGNKMQTLTNAESAKLIEDSLTNKELDALSYSDEYAEFIMANAKADRVICNGDMLLDAMEDGYLFDEFLINKFV